MRLHVLFHSDLMGRYRWPGCRKKPVGRGSYAQMIGGIELLRNRIKKAGDPAPVVLSAGNMLGPDVLGQFLFAHPRKWAPKVVSLIARAGYDALLVGRHDWAAQLKKLATYMKLSVARGLRLLAANVECKEKSDFRCRHLGHVGQPFVLVRRGPLKIAILGAVRRDLPKHLNPPNNKGISTKDPVAVLRPLIRRLRQKLSVDVVIVMADLESSESSPRNLLKLMRDLGADAPELLVGNAMYASGSQKTNHFVSQVTRAEGSAIVGTSRFGQHLGHTVITLQPHKRHAAKQPRPTKKTTPKQPNKRKRPNKRKTQLAKVATRVAAGRFSVKKITTKQHPVAAFAARSREKKALAAMMKAMCQTMDVPLGKGVISPPMSRPAFIRYMLRIVMRATHSELAILPDTLFADANFPLSGKLTRETVCRAIRFTDPVGVFKVKGSYLKKKLKKYLSQKNPALWMEGLKKKGKLYYVNDRLLMEEQHYRIATTQFVANGGGDLIPRQKTFETLVGKESVRKLAILFFRKNRQNKYDGRNDIDLRRDFLPLNRKSLVSLVMDANLSLNDVSILNPGVYTDQPQLTRERILGLLFNTTVTVEAINHINSFSAAGTIKYGKSKTWITDETTGISSSSTAETDDIVSLYLLYKYLQMHPKYDPAKWYYPIPYVEAYIETEITRDLRSEKGELYRYTETAGMVGPGFMPYPKLFLKTGFVTRSHNILIPEERKVELGLYAGFTLTRHPIVKIAKYPIYLESRLDFYLTSLRKDRIKEFIWTNKVSFALISHLFLNVAHEFYIYDNREYDVNMASNLTVGVQVLMDFRHQTF